MPKSHYALLIDSLRHVVTHQDSIITSAATRTVQVTTPPPNISVNVPPGHWWDSSLIGGALAAVIGIGATYLFGSIHRRYVVRHRVSQALGTELSILLARLIGASTVIASRRRRLDLEMIDRLLATIGGTPASSDLARMQDSLKKLKLPGALAAYLAADKGPDLGLGLRRYELPYLSSGLPNMELFDERTQVLVLEVQGALELFNQHVEDVMRYHWLTFENLTPANHRIVEENVVRAQTHALNSALNVATRVGLALRQREFQKLRPIRAQLETLSQD